VLRKEEKAQRKPEKNPQGVGLLRHLNWRKAAQQTQTFRAGARKRSNPLIKVPADGDGAAGRGRERGI